MLETSLFVAGIAALGMLSPARIFPGDQKRRPLSAAGRHDDRLRRDLRRRHSHVLLRRRAGGGDHHHAVVFNLLKYAGAVYLVWIGIQALLSRAAAR